MTTFKDRLRIRHPALFGFLRSSKHLVSDIAYLLNWRRGLCFLGRLGRVAVREPLTTTSAGRHDRTTLRYRNILDALQHAHPEKDLPILDVACGPTGGLAVRFHDAGYTRVHVCDYFTVDKLAPSLRPHVTYSQVDLNTNGPLPYPSAHFHLISCSQVLEHLEHPAKILRELARILAPQGTLVITVPNSFHLMARFRLLFTGVLPRYGHSSHPYQAHISVFPTAVLQSLCDRAGLEIAQQGGGFCFWEGHFWLPAVKFSHLFSYNAHFTLRHKGSTQLAAVPAPKAAA